MPCVLLSKSWHIDELLYPTSGRVNSWRGGGRLGINHAGICVSKSEGYKSILRLKVNETNETMSFKIGVKFAVSLNMGEILC